MSVPYNKRRCHWLTALSLPLDFLPYLTCNLLALCCCMVFVYVYVVSFANGRCYFSYVRRYRRNYVDLMLSLIAQLIFSKREKVKNKIFTYTYTFYLFVLWTIWQNAGNYWRRITCVFDASSAICVIDDTDPRLILPITLSSDHTSNNVEATFDFVAKTATMSNEFCVKISSFRQSRRLLRHCCQKRQQCQNNRQQSFQLLQQCCLHIVAGVDRALEVQLERSVAVCVCVSVCDVCVLLFGR